MLHKVPDSSLRRYLLHVVRLQRRLVKALCALPAGSSVDQAWLCSVWNRLDPEWVRRFWENDSGKRADWIRLIAKATAAEKQEIREITAEQLRFRELWGTTPSVRMRQVDWKRKTFSALRALLKCFYAPVFYYDNGRGGYTIRGTTFHKDLFLRGFPPGEVRVCPYCDNNLQNIELDHFLPKNDFPFLSCHPDNLIPSCPDSNSGSRKGTTVPLDWGEADQAGAWFHPRWRSGKDLVEAEVKVTPDQDLAMELAAVNPADASRVTNLNATFGISEFWSRHLQADLQTIGSEICDMLREENATPTEDAVRRKLLSRAERTEKEIGQRGLSIRQRALYLFAANTPSVVSDIARACI